MKYIVMPITDAKFVFSEDELAHMRKSNDGTQVIVHEEILLNKREGLGLSILPTDTDGNIEWTYPNYLYGSDELNTLLESKDWKGEEEV